MAKSRLGIWSVTLMFSIEIMTITSLLALLRVATESINACVISSLGSGNLRTVTPIYSSLEANQNGTVHLCTGSKHGQILRYQGV